MERLAGKVAIVTGASRGIGRAIVEKFADEGATVIINYSMSEKRARELAESIDKKYGRALAIKADVASSKEVNDMVSETLSRFGHIDILVNNAGVIIRKPFLESTEKDWDKTMEVNLKGTYLCCKAVAPVMLRQKSGVIINIASITGFTGLPAALGTADYVASKAGVLALTRSLAVALSPSVRVNAIAPGIVDTEMTEDMSTDRKKRSIDETPLGAHAQPEDIANAAVFLASDESRWITGEILTVAGGRAMR